MKIKATLKENVSNRNVYLKYFLTDSRYYDDIKNIGDAVQVDDSIEKLESDKMKYDYIVVEDIKIDKETIGRILKLLVSKCNPNAMIILEASYFDKEMLDNCVGSSDVLKMLTIPEDDEKMWAVLYLK